MIRLAFIIGLIVGACGCKSPYDVASCVQRCEKLGYGCYFEKVYTPWTRNVTMCRCYCDFEFPLDGGRR